ncbi:Efflux ABC transporter, permease/ATP-binding protein [hydrothermal vent metagenome]|uniref:Efflux ABC transporter, permease/ATP-binding protein n=1 Tax=hydrothermal vent metagenome TaxID=652676 RepID=A0A3B0V3E1_9ZZZZ
MKIYLRLLKYIRPYSARLSAAIICMLLFALTNGALAYLLGPALKTIFNSASGSGGGGASSLIPFDLITVAPENMTFVIPSAIIILAFIKGFSSYGNTYYMGFIGQRVIADVRISLYNHILRLPLGYFTKNPTGTLTSKLTSDVNMLQKTTASALTYALKQAFSMIILVVVILSLDWQLAILAFVVFPIAVYPAIRLGRTMKRASKKGQMTMGSMTSLLYEAISGIRIVKAFSMENYETGKFKIENDTFTRHMIKTVKVRGISTPLMETLGAVGFALTILYATYRISSGTLKPEDFISFFAATLMLYQPLKALNGVHLNIQQGIASAQRIFDVIDTPTEFDLSQSRNTTAQKTLTAINDSVELRNLSFSYGDRRIINNINLRVKKGEKIALVGSSGAGKTTLVNLIPRFYDPDSGAVLIDGTDIKDITIKSLRDQISVVSQEVILFNDTIRNNIAYGREEKSLEAVTGAAIAANAHSFIQSLPKGYDTVIGERGITLSGGERQRISIARAILKNAPLLIMDEATSSLDAESEFEVQKGLDNLMAGRTTFVIAHRLSTVKNADKIVVLSGGRIKETGRHEELLVRGGEYARLYRLQFRTTGQDEDGEEGIA